jgi:NAD(P)-dependent dehydrogenase (short-subunit alcohol dehydrogenase family)
MDLSNKIIVVVGGAMGIGKATAELCAKRGATVVVADFNETEGKATANTLGGMFLPVDVTNEASVKAVFSKIDETFGKLDVLFPTAGILLGAYVDIEDFGSDVFRKVYEVNVLGSFLCAKYAVPLMKKAGKGVIVYVSSGAATGVSSSYAYGSSKGGVLSLGITSAGKLAEHNIRVNVLSPGNIATYMKLSVIEIEAKQRGITLEERLKAYNLGDPAGMAKVLAWLASDDADYVRGTIQTR